MKSKLLLLSFLMLLMVTTNYGQSSASVSGIAVQGIARDDNNTAIANESISFKFTIYYKNPGRISVYDENTSITTDAFGVFSHVLDVDPSTISKFANNVLSLEIEAGGNVISDEIFKHVPYAISANNGVPTGSIMPYIGTTAPAGWVLCNGQPLNVINGSADLMVLVGANAPDLQGMFLRGTGTNPVNSQAGPTLKTTQGDGFKSHNHSGSTSLDGVHTHTSTDVVRNTGGTSYNISGGERFASNGTTSYSRTSSSDGNHNHSISNDGTNETRPVNYGVNYIIKL
tara:strand:- start:2129 stop:2983 length:855 start_codon:yes stop_codon:yes gene_type:complete